MGLIIKGIRKISQLEIDANKDWNSKGITSLKELASGMQIGDVIVRGTNVLEIIAAGPNGYVLTSAGPGKKPVWAPAGGALAFYFPVPIELFDMETVIAAVDQSISKNAPFTSAHVETSVDLPASMVKRQDATLASVDAENVIAAADESIAATAPLKAAMSIIVDGFITESAFDTGSHDAADSATVMTDSLRSHWVVNALVGGVIYNLTDGSSGTITANTDHTATVAALAGGADNTWQAGDTYKVMFDKTSQAQSAAANDMPLNPQMGTLGDKVYFGSTYKFWEVLCQLGTQGVGNWTNAYSYWNGAWTAVVDENDGSNEWQTAAGLKMISHTVQGDWVTTTLMGKNLYWLKSECSNFVNQATKPLGTQAWVAINV